MNEKLFQGMIIKNYTKLVNGQKFVLSHFDDLKYIALLKAPSISLNFWKFIGHIFIITFYAGILDHPGILEQHMEEVYLRPSDGSFLLISS